MPVPRVTMFWTLNIYCSDRGTAWIEGAYGHKQGLETANFHGPHFVECYVIKNGVCVARDRIDVPIE
ncbi:MAG: nucleotide-binding domain-containing protein [Trinickia sp.]|uniref:nucleotide-binding domain-containing protein n=1 Tax=Trinickia sp. TaxID=2571163 RepID=UPI003F81D26C